MLTAPVAPIKRYTEVIREKLLEAAARRPGLKQFFLFAAAGGVATIVQYCTLIALVEIGRVPPTYAAVPAYICGAITSYSLNRRFAFTGTARSSRSTFLKFFLVNLIGLGLNTLLLGLFLKAGAHYLVGQAAATILVLFWNFAGAKFFAFRS